MFNWLPGLQGPFLENCCLPSQPQLVPMHGVMPSQAQEFIFGFVELHKVPLWPFIQLVKVPPRQPYPPAWGLHPPGWCHSQPCRGLIHASPSPRLLMKMVNRISPSVSLPGTSDCCQLDFQSLTTTTSPYLLNEAMWVICKSMSKALLNLRQTSTALHLVQSPAFHHRKHSGYSSAVCLW